MGLGYNPQRVGNIATMILLVAIGIAAMVIALILVWTSNNSKDVDDHPEDYVG